MADGKLTLGTAQGWAVSPASDTHTAIVFKVDGTPIGAVVKNDDLSRLTERIIQEAAKHAAKKAARIEQGESITANPIPVSSIALGHGRSDTEALLAMRFGNLTLTFAVELSNIRNMCTRVLQATKEGPSRKPN